MVNREDLPPELRKDEQSQPMIEEIALDPPPDALPPEPPPPPPPEPFLRRG